MGMTLKSATAALEQYRKLLAEIAEIEKREGLDEKRDQAFKLKADVTTWAVENDLDTIPLDGAHAKVVKQSYGSHWVSTADDLVYGDYAENVKPLYTLIEETYKSRISTQGSKARKMWMRLTKRVADPVAIDEAFADGAIKVEEISSAFVEKEKKPYIRIFND
jgi:hypothetical protein